MLDRIRANPDADYNLAVLGDAPVGDDARSQDLQDFQANIESFAGASGTGRIRVHNRQVTISIDWDDSRAGAGVQTFTLASRVAVDPPGGLQ
ncbi:hypothetical protein D3C85_1249810 [compost metagenome]